MGEGVVDPVGEEDAKVQGAQLHAHVQATASLGTVFGLENWSRAVDDFTNVNTAS